MKLVNAINDRIAIRLRDYEKYGCTGCGHDKAYWSMSGMGCACGNCGKCGRWLMVVPDNATECPVKIGTGEGEAKEVPIVRHPRAAGEHSAS